MRAGARWWSVWWSSQARERNSSHSSARQLQALVRRHSGLRAALLPWFLGFQWRGRYVRADRTCAGHNMTFAPGWSQGCSERFQLTLEIASRFPAGLRCEFKNVVLLEIEHPQVELRRRLRESLMIDHAVSAIHDPRIRVNLCNSSRQVGKRRYSDRDAPTRGRCEFSDERREGRCGALVGRCLHISNEL